MQRWELLWDMTYHCTVLMEHKDARKHHLTFTLLQFIILILAFKLLYRTTSWPKKVFFFFFFQTRKYCKRQTRIYICCLWVQTAGISVVLWPYGLENSLQSLTECLSYSRVSVIYGFVSRSSDSVSSSFTQEPFISCRHRWTLKWLRPMNPFLTQNNKISSFLSCEWDFMLLMFYVILWSYMS